MPHVIVKLLPGKSEDQKNRLASAIAKDVMDILQHREEVVSVSLEEVNREDWAEKVYRQEILQKPENVYKKPGYNPFEK